MPDDPEVDALLTPREVAALLRVDPKTVSRWALDGKLASVLTIGGHRRYPAWAVRRLMSGEGGRVDRLEPELSDEEAD